MAYQNVASDIHSIAISGCKASVKAGGEILVDLNSTANQPSSLDQSVTNGHHTLNTFPFEGKFDLDLAARTILQAEITVDDSEWIDA